MCRLFTLLAAVTLSVSPLYSVSAHLRPDQIEAKVTFQTERERPKFLCDTFVFATQDRETAVLNIFVEFVHDLLQFRLQGGRYLAEYEIVVELLNAAGERVAGTIDRDGLETAVYEETNSRKHVTRTHWRFSLPAGRYQLYIEFTDLETDRNLVCRKSVVVDDFSEPVVLSDLAFVDRREYDGDGLVLSSPNLLRTWQEVDSEFGAYFEIYSSARDSVWLNYRIYNQTGDRLLNRDETVRMRHGRLNKMIPLRQLVWWPGKYILVVEARAGGHKGSARSHFEIQHWEPSPLFLQKERANYTLSAMRYIAGRDEFRALMNAGEAERVQRLEQFWQQRDPTPETERNELRELFQERVDYAVKHYSNFVLAQSGCDSDRGRIYILHGPPSEQHRLRYEQTCRYYEIWYYKNMDRRFVFLDKAGMGRFKLIHRY
ncbi:MAG: GWxTD domain-containing protein [bacterium]